MIETYLAPNSFFGYDIILEFLFAIITITVAAFAFKIYKATSQKHLKHLSSAFLLIGISNIIQSILNILIITKANENICQIIKIQSIQLFNFVGMVIHMAFMITGLVILTYMTLKINKKELIALMITISLAAIFLSSNAIYMFYVLASIYLIAISSFFIKNYLEHKKTKTLLIAVAFLFLLFGHMHYLLAINNSLFYILGHLLELVAYILILFNLYLVLKR